MRTFIACIKFLVLICLCAVGAVLLFAADIASRSIEAELARRGLSPNKVSVSKITPWQTRIDSFEVPIPAVSIQGSVSFKELVLDYIPVKDMRMLRANASFDSGAILLRRKNAGQGGSAGGEVRWWDYAVPRLPLSIVRFRRLDIDEGVISRSRFSLGGSIINTADAVRAALVVDDAFGNKGHGKAVLNRSGQHSAWVKLQAASFEPFSSIIPTVALAAPFLDSAKPFNVDADLEFSGPLCTVKGSAALRLANTREVPVKGELSHNFAERLGDLHYSITTLDISSGGADLASFLPSSAALNLQAGVLNLKGGVSWKWNEAKSRWNVVLQQTSGSLEEAQVFKEPFSLKGIAASFAFDSLAPLRTAASSPVVLAVRQADVVFPVRDISVKLHVQGAAGAAIPRIRIENASANLFDAEFSVGFAVFDPSKRLNAFVVKIEGLDLAKLLEQYPQENLKGTGVLDGVLPLVVSREGKPSIPGGRLTARAPGGVLKYATGMADSGNGGMFSEARQVFHILEDFRYQQMIVDVSYRESGDMLLGVHLTGDSPLFQQGRKVNLNVKVEENIPALIQSVLLTSGVGEKVGERIVDRFDPSK